MKITPYTPQNRQNQPNFKAKHCFTTEGGKATFKMAELFDSISNKPSVTYKSFNIALDPESKTIYGKFDVDFAEPRGKKGKAEKAFLKDIEAYYKAPN